MNLLTPISYFKIADIGITVNSDKDLGEIKYSTQLSKFKISSPGSDDILINHHFLDAPDIQSFLSNKVYSIEPWDIYPIGRGWLYISPCLTDQNSLIDIALFTDFQHRNNHYYHINNHMIKFSPVHSVTFTPTDQILLSQVLSYRSGFYVHAGGVIFENKGFLFVGHSGAGKSTILKTIRPYGKILCDDRIIVREDSQSTFRIFGTWSSGELPDVSPDNCPLTAIFFLEQSSKNRITKLSSLDFVRMMPFYIIKSLITRDWWQRTLDVVEKLSHQVPCYRLEFDKSGEVLEILKGF